MMRLQKLTKRNCALRDSALAKLPVKWHGVFLENIDLGEETNLGTNNQLNREPRGTCRVAREAAGDG